MFDTRNDLPANTRTKVIELLNARLADAIDLGAQTKHAHWNVKGPNFIALHELFDKVAESVEEHIDTLAERVTALGGTARGTLATVARSTRFLLSTPAIQRPSGESASGDDISPSPMNFSRIKEPGAVRSASLRTSSKTKEADPGGRRVSV